MTVDAASTPAPAQRAITPGRPVDLGDLRRREPLSRLFGSDRGRCIDRYYIERFLEAHAACIRGRVLEVAESTYTRRFGGAKVQVSDVLHVSSDHPRATLVADLTRPAQFPHQAFDCVLLTQTLPFIYDVHAAVATLHRILRPGGSVLATVPGISQISRYDMERWGDYWRFTPASAQRLFADEFGRDRVQVEVFGNVLAATGLLYGLAAEELSPPELDHYDPDYPVIIGVRATRAEEPPCR